MIHPRYISTACKNDLSAFDAVVRANTVGYASVQPTHLETSYGKDASLCFCYHQRYTRDQSLSFTGPDFSISTIQD